jgi:TPR repeat protein
MHRLPLLAAFGAALVAAAPAWSDETEDFAQAAAAHQRKDFTTAFDGWLALAKRGLVDAQINVALMYQYAEGTRRDIGETLRWLRLAAEQGDQEAQIRLGNLHLRGEGVERDEAQANYWFTRFLRDHHFEHIGSEQMLVWRARAQDLLWREEMTASVEAGDAQSVIAALRERLEPATRLAQSR